MRDEKEESKQGQTNKAKQHSTPKAVTFPRKNELPGWDSNPRHSILLYMNISSNINYMYTCMLG